MSGPLTGTRGAILARSVTAERAGALLASLGAEIADSPDAADFCIVDTAEVPEAPETEGLVVVTIGDGEAGGAGGVGVLEAVAAVVTGLRHRGQTGDGQRIDLDPRDAVLAARGEALLAWRVLGAEPAAGAPLPGLPGEGFPVRFARARVVGEGAAS